MRKKIKFYFFSLIFVFSSSFFLNLSLPVSVYSENSAENKITVNLTPEELEFVQNNPQIKVSNKLDWIPMDFSVEGEASGFGVDFVKLLFERVNLEPVFITGYSWNEVLDLFYKGKIDLVHSLNMTKERQEKALFSRPYYYSRNVIVQRINDPSIESPENLSGKIIAVPKGWASAEYISNNFPQINILEVTNSRTAFEFVENGNAFAAVEQKAVADYLIKKFGFTDLTYTSNIADLEIKTNTSLHFAVLKEKRILMNILEKSFNSISSDEMNVLEKKWFGEKGLNFGFDDIGLDAEEKKYLKNKKIIKYCIPPNKMPLAAVENGQVTGMAADFIKIFETKLGVKFKLVTTENWSDTINLVKACEAEILPFVNKTPERSEYLLFTKSYLDYPVVIITSGSIHYVSGLKGLKDKTVAVIEGSHVHEKMKNYPGIKLILCENHQDGLLKVSNNEVDALLGVLPVALHDIKWLGITNLKIAGIAEINDEHRVGVLKEDEILYSIMSKAVNSLTHSEIEEIRDKWISFKFEKEFNYILLFKIIGAAAAVIAVFIVWNRQLVKLNNKIKEANKSIIAKSRELEIMTITDSLTGLYNRRHLELSLNSEILRFKRYKRPLSAMIIDIDNFKSVNDTFGHIAGDNVLIKVSDILKNEIRVTDISGRWGGEEFMVICPETDMDGALSLAESLRQKVESLDLGDVGLVTISIGAASLDETDDEISFVKRADKALYIAKSKGKNRVELIL